MPRCCKRSKEDGKTETDLFKREKFYFTIKEEWLGQVQEFYLRILIENEASSSFVVVGSLLVLLQDSCWKESVSPRKGVGKNLMLLHYNKW